MSTERSEQRRIVEALVLASPEPVSAGKLASVVPDATPSRVSELVEELNAEYSESGRGFEIREVAGGFQIRTRAEMADHVRALQPRRAARLSRAALETLAVVAYKQPVTRAEVEHVRGVDAGAVLRGLLERDLVRIAGHREIPGRPILYATTRRFLEVFGLGSLEDLPTLRELDELLPPEERIEGDDDAPDAPEDDVDPRGLGSFASAHEAGADGSEADADADLEDEDPELAALLADDAPRGEPH